MLKFLRHMFLLFALPFNRAVGHWHLPCTHKRITYANVQIILRVLAPGCVLLSYTRGEATNWLIPGKYKHGAIYVGEGLIVEAVGGGVRCANLIDFCMTKDRIIVLKPKFATLAQMAAAANWALSQRGKPYDYEFSSDNDQFYCLEITYAAYREVLAASPWELRETWGVPTVMPDDFLRATDKWERLLEL